MIRPLSPSSHARTPRDPARRPVSTGRRRRGRRAADAPAPTDATPARHRRRHRRAAADHPPESADLPGPPQGHSRSVVDVLVHVEVDAGGQPRPTRA